ncbi:hypothetical protein C6500_02050 [Candidatus Poribacteria bacterium]|nr:MAG: hypothetical protein C6500_02050 [Candidatus Poribacteria bacterium]
MNRDTISTVKPEYLGWLSPAESTLFVRDLLWAEARRLGPGTCRIDVPSEINATDGGIDAIVDANLSVLQNDIIEPGKNGYQIKSGSEFKPWQKSQIRKELFGAPRTPMTKENLGPSIRACLEGGGIYVLVCTGINLSKSQLRKAHSHIKECLDQCGYQNPIKVWSQDDLISFLQEFPFLELNLRGFREEHFQTHRIWSQHQDLQVPFIPGQSQNELIQKIQNDLQRDDYPVHVRVWGEPGIGKTRLVLEATRVENLSPFVIYCRSATQFESSVLMNEIRFNDNLFAIVVIDECDPDSRARIWHELQHYSPRIKLITIYNDYEEIPGDIAYHVTPPLEREQIRNIIIQEYKIPPDQADRWAELCDGSPRVAHVIGWNLVNHPEDVLKPPSTVNIWDRYIAAGDAPRSEKTEQRRLVLQYLALFKRFGYKGPVDDETQIIASMIEEANPQITWDRFQEIIYELKERRILQGEFTLYVTPKALHIKLWAQWWERRSQRFNFETFRQNLTPKLVEWFYEMFQYAAESDAALGIVDDLLGPNGPFQDDEYLKTRLGSRFFSALTEANPKSALRCLMRTIGTWDRDTLLQFTEGRRYVIWALEKIAIWRELFADAARLLLALGEAENEGYSNSASGVFSELFSPGPGRVAPTEATPAERLPILKEALESNSKERRSLGLKACNTALKSGYFSRMGNVKYQGLRRAPQLWEPKTYGELWGAYRQVWQLLCEQLANLPQDERKEAAEILLGHAGELGKIPNLSDMVVETVRTIVYKRYINQKQVIETISRILYHDDTYKDNGLSTETRQHFEELRNELVGSDFHSLMQRYVGMDLLEDRLDEHKDGIDRVQPHLERLAQQAIEDMSLLQEELSWLVTTEAKNGYKFGFELGKRDINFRLLPTLLDAQRDVDDNTSVYFLGGYFRVIFERNPVQWEEQLDALIEDTSLNVLIPELTHRSGLTDQAGLRLLNLAKGGIINANHFGVFVYGQAIKNLSNEVFTAWIEFLLNETDKSTVSIALNLCDHYYIREELEITLPIDITFRMLTHASLFKESNKDIFDTMTNYYWTEIGKAFLRLYPEKSLELAELMLKFFGIEGTIVGGFTPQTAPVLEEATRLDPEQAWKCICKYLEAPVETSEDWSRKFSIERWLRETDIPTTIEKDEGALTLIPHHKIWEWIDNDVENRAQYLAHNLVPKTALTASWSDSLARATLVRYGAQEDVRRALISNYLTGVSWGLMSSNYEVKKQNLLHIKNNENNENVKRWIDDFVDVLERDIEAAKVREEREL